MAILYVGIDLAKNVFAVHGANEAGRPELVRPAVPRARLHELIAALPPCTVAMEVCSGGHHWARLFAARRCRRPRLTNEAPARVFHQGPQHMSCSNDRL